MSATPATLGQRLGIGLSSIVLFLIVLFGALGLVVLLVWPWWLVALVGLAAIVLTLPWFLIRRLISGRNENWSPKTTFVSTALVLFLILSAIVAFPVYYLSYLVDARPTLMPFATLTNGTKTVQFQGMQHIGSESFYKSVVYDLREALSQGYRLYYEGVKPDPAHPELDAWFNQLATGGAGADLSGFYKTLADACGLRFQLDYFQGLTKDFEIHPDRHLTADVDYSELKTEYDRLMREDPVFAADMGPRMAAKRSPDRDNVVLETVLAAWKTSTPDQRRLMGLVCRGFFSWTFSQAQAPSQKDKLILDYRNAALARTIIEDKADKIWITYGANHLPGVIADLKKADPNWQLVNLKWSRVIANPEEFHKPLE